MENQELIERLASIIESQADLEALESLIKERRDFLMYRATERGFYFGAQSEPETAQQP